MRPEKCGICESEYQVTWTDTHGIAACLTCNVSYIVYHYEGEKRVDKPAELDVAPEWVERLREYWNETNHKIPNGRNMPGSDYERCEGEDFIEFGLWVEGHKAEWGSNNGAEVA